MPKNPNRLALQGHARLPSQAKVSGWGASPGEKTPMMGPTARRQVIPVNVIDAFYQMLPSPGIQQQAIASETRFDFSSVNTVNGQVVGSIATRSQQVYIWTDLTFYALIPGEGLTSPPVQLDMHQLSGLLRFTMEIDNTDPMNLVSNPESPYNDPLLPSQGNLSGWGTLDRDFGSTRYGVSFALYARSGQVTRIGMKTIQLDRAPRFVLDRIGYEIHGYVTSEAEFEEVWRRTIGG